MGPEDFLRATLQFDVAGASNPVIMTFDWQCVGATDAFALADEGDDISLAIVARYLIPLEDYLSNDVTLTQIDLRAWAFPADGWTQVGALWQGNNADLMLPPFVTMAFRLARQNFNMRNGRKAFPGTCTTHVGANGKFNTSVADSLAVITAVWSEEPMLVEGVAVDMTFEERIIRMPTVDGVNPSVWSPVAAWGRAYFGSQNSRK